MIKPRIILADTDEGYMNSLQLKFIEELFEAIDLEIITDENYFQEFLTRPQRAEILVVSEDLYSEELKKHNISHVFILTEQHGKGKVDSDFKAEQIFKYTSTKEIFNEITGKSSDVFQLEDMEKNDSQIVVVYSASGGSGKTVVSLGLCSSLYENYKKVLYIDAEWIHSFQYLLENNSAIAGNDVYSKLARSRENVYTEIKHVIRTERFAYLPPFKAPLMSLGISPEVYLKIILGAKKSRDYDYIIVDTDSSFDEFKGELLNIADKVIVVTNQSGIEVYKTSHWLSFINGEDNDKYMFLCNDFNKDDENMIISSDMKKNFNINLYVGHIENNKMEKLESFANVPDIKKSAMLVI